MNHVGCIVIPYFVAALEHLTEPIQKPLVLCTSEGVYSVSESAAKAGVAPGTALRRVRLLCPDAELRTPRSVTYRQTFESLLAVLRDFSNRIEPASPILQNVRNRAKFKAINFGTDDGLSAVIYIDMDKLNPAACEQLAAEMISTIQQKTRLSASIGIAQGKFPARIAAACTPAGHVQIVSAGSEDTFLANLSVAALPIEESIIEQLQLLGIKTLSQIAVLPVTALNAQFGKKGILLSQLARGEDHRPVVAHKPSSVVRAKHEFEVPISNSQTIEAVLSVLADELSEKLDLDGSVAGYVELVIQTESAAHERSLAFAQSVSLSGNILTNLLALFQTTRLKTGVISLDVTLSGLMPRLGRQLELFTHQQSRESRLRSKLREVVNKYGAECFNWIEVHREARLPEERFVLRSVS